MATLYAMLLFELCAKADGPEVNRTNANTIFTGKKHNACFLSKRYIIKELFRAAKKACLPHVQELIYFFICFIKVKKY